MLNKSTASQVVFVERLLSDGYISKEKALELLGMETLEEKNKKENEAFLVKALNDTVDDS